MGSTSRIQRRAYRFEITFGLGPNLGPETSNVLSLAKLAARRET